MERMEWKKLLRPIDESGKEFNEPSRSRFEKDYDRLIYSTAFRRLQMKTQVYPLSGLTMVHNRLTHTLEVASVGRSLARSLYNLLKDEKYGKEVDFCKGYPNNIKDEKGKSLADRCSDSLLTDLQAIVMSACLAHDIGNPPFGHFGEKAIRYSVGNYINSKQADISNPQQKADLLTFDGNANVFRMLTFPYSNKGNYESNEKNYGLCLSYPTFATIIKYPWDSLTAIDLEKDGKFGFFYNEQAKFKEIARALGLTSQTNTQNGIFRCARHPLVFLMEAADDICNFFVDLQDGEHLKLIPAKKVFDCLRALLNTRDKVEFKKIEEEFEFKREIDSGDAVLYLRTYVYDTLVKYCITNFEANYDEIMSGNFMYPLIDGKKDKTGWQAGIQESIDAVKTLKKEKLFSAKKVIQLELAGLDVIKHLIGDFWNGLHDKVSLEKSKKVIEGKNLPKEEKNNLLKELKLGIMEGHLIQLLPPQFLNPLPENDYETMLYVVDFVSRMTDEYALDLHRKITGQKIPELY